MLSFLALLAGCGSPVPQTIDVEPPAPPEADAFAAPIAEVALPAGAAKVNRACFGGSSDAKSKVATTTAAPSGGAGVAKPSERLAAGAMAPSAPPPAMAAPAPDAAVPMRKDEAKVAAEIAVGDDEAPADGDRDASGGGPDWGGVTYLSNDDSMSLASAQRVIWALQKGKPVDASQVRPHEVLNYFSFDTVPVADGALFSVNASAEKIDADSLSMALAIKGASPAPKPLDLTIVIDRSGSMSEEGRMAYVKAGLGLLSENLRRGDRVDVVLFDNVVCTPLQDYVVGRDDPALLTDTFASMQPRGGTNISVGLKEAYKIATARTDSVGVRNQRVLLLTDALVNQGIVDADTLSEVGRGFDEKGIRLSGVGVGSEFNDKILDKLTEKGKGAYVFLGSEAVTNRVFGAGFESLVSTIAHDVRFRLDLPPSLAMERFYGEESSTDPEEVQPIHYYAGTTQLFLQDLVVDPAKVSPKDEVVLTIEYTDAATGAASSQVFRTTLGAMFDSDRHNVGKARALMAWTDLVSIGAMGGAPCKDPLAAWTTRATAVSDDAEIAFVHGLVKGQCPAAGELPPPPVKPATSSKVAYKVKVDSDVPIAEAALWCAGAEHKKTLSASDTIARFEVAPGSCKLTLHGAVPLEATVTVPEVGGDVRCLVRGGRIACS